MVHIFTKEDRVAYPDAFDAMFRARAAVFHDRLGWAVNVQEGLEIDGYDAADPVYLMTSDARGDMTGSLRLLPTTGPTMLKSEFSSFFDEPVDIDSPTAWECTRFCVHPLEGDVGKEQLRRVSSDLLIGLCELGLSSGIEHITGVYDARMIRIYARIGWCAVPLAKSRPEIGSLYVGLWDVTTEALENMKWRATRDISAIAGSKAA